MSRMKCLCSDIEKHWNAFRSVCKIFRTKEHKFPMLVYSSKFYKRSSVFNMSELCNNPYLLRLWSFSMPRNFTAITLLDIWFIRYFSTKLVASKIAVDCLSKERDLIKKRLVFKLFFHTIHAAEIIKVDRVKILATRDVELDRKPSCLR